MGEFRRALPSKRAAIALRNQPRNRIAAIMRGNKKKDTRPELAVRRLLSQSGYRYRLHARELPGVPDIVFRKAKKVIFVHGCFWHQHPSASCKLVKVPRSNVRYWGPKLAGNRRRDVMNVGTLSKYGWRVLEIWECEVSEPDALVLRLRLFLSE